jgi:H+ antiporter protein
MAGRVLSGALMLKILNNPTYRSLFLAQIASLLGTGLTTVALGLLAYDLAGPDAGAVLGTALAIKMIAYVGMAPIASAFVERLPRRTFLIGLDVLRAVIVLFLPFVDQIWQVYVLIFVLQSASAAFTPTFQATIPDILPDEAEYTKALSLSRLAYDLENLLSPTLAATLLALISFHWLFAGTALGFILSALLVWSVSLPSVLQRERRARFFSRVTKGARYYLATPRLRGLLSLNMAAAAAGAMVLVNTVVYVRALLGLSEPDVAVALAAFGAGSMMAALLLPSLLERIADRPVMLAGAAGLVAGLLLIGTASIDGPARWEVLIAIWLMMGISYSSVLTPSGRLLRRSSHQEDRPALFAAQFALSHACWLVTYPLAGWMGAQLGMAATSFLLAALAALGMVIAFALWPANDPGTLEHIHDELPADHPHVQDAMRTHGGLKHAHDYVIDDHHHHWPSRA